MASTSPSTVNHELRWSFETEQSILKNFEFMLAGSVLRIVTGVVPHCLGGMFLGETDRCTGDSLPRIKRGIPII